MQQAEGMRLSVPMPITMEFPVHPTPLCHSPCKHVQPLNGTSHTPVEPGLTLDSKHYRRNSGHHYHSDQRWTSAALVGIAASSARAVVRSEVARTSTTVSGIQRFALTIVEALSSEHE